MSRPPSLQTRSTVRSVNPTRVAPCRGSVVAGVAFLAAAVLAFPPVAQAGFQWIAPPSVEQAPPAASMPPVLSPVESQPPVTTLKSTASPSLVMDDNPEPLVPSAAEGENILGAEPSFGKAEKAQSTVQSLGTLRGSESTASSGAGIVHGFAKQVPLAVALRQILPAGYGFSVDHDVDLGILVSFRGGKSWHETLAEALEPVGLTSHEKGQLISIGHVAPTVVGEKTSPSVSLPSLQESVMASPVSTMPPLKPHSQVLTKFEPLPETVVISGSESGILGMSSWNAERGDSLHQVLEKWSRRANVEFDWLAEYDYPLQASVSFSGGYEEAVRNLLTGFETAHPQPMAQLHANSKLGQQVLVVETRGNNYTN